MKNKDDNKLVKITLKKSLIGTKEKHRQIIKGLGLTKINSHSTLKETPEIRGMINKVNYLIKCE